MMGMNAYMRTTVTLTTMSLPRYEPRCVSEACPSRKY